MLNALAELRLVAEPQAAVSRLIEQYQLESAVPVLQRFLQDVGLWVVADTVTIADRISQRRHHEWIETFLVQHSGLPS